MLQMYIKNQHSLNNLVKSSKYFSQKLVTIVRISYFCQQNRRNRFVKWAEARKET